MIEFSNFRVFIQPVRSQFPVFSGQELTQNSSHCFTRMPPNVRIPSGAIAAALKWVGSGYQTGA
jgi:hypothetical protein